MQWPVLLISSMSSLMSAVHAKDSLTQPEIIHSQEENVGAESVNTSPKTGATSSHIDIIVGSVAVVVAVAALLLCLGVYSRQRYKKRMMMAGVADDMDDDDGCYPEIDLGIKTEVVIKTSTSLKCSNKFEPELLEVLDNLNDHHGQEQNSLYGNGDDLDANQRIAITPASPPPLHVHL